MHPRLTLILTRRWPIVVLAALTALAAIGGTALGYNLKLDLPDVQALEDYAPPLMTRVLARDGSVVTSFAHEQRILIEYPDIPPAFVQALVATEDSRFFDHTGIDVRGMARALWTDLMLLRLEEGASTLTQQLARCLFLHPRKLWRRKFQEIVLALEIERNYSKQEILWLYANHMYFGHGRYGLEAAAQYYTGRSARELTLPDAALLAGILQRPSKVTPLLAPDAARERRNHVLSRMTREGFITAEQAKEASETPLPERSGQGRDELAPYFVEEVRRWLQREFGTDDLYQAGLDVRTTLDPRLQRIANQAVDAGLRELDKRQGWRGVQRRVPDDVDARDWEDGSWKDGILEGRIYAGVVVDAVKNKGAELRIGRYRATLTRSQVAWTDQGDPARFLKRGDIVEVRVEALGDDGSATVALEQTPEVEGALVAIEPQSGDILAMVGGLDFGRSEFNRATQARRQTGSAFKPFVYAAALDASWTSADTVIDEPTVFIDTATAEPYQPENITRRYLGRLTLRRALERSANIGTVKLITELGFDPVIDTARKLGISGRLRPFPSLALGAFEVTLTELTSAYGTFGNQGVHVEPHLVREVLQHDGTVLRRVEPTVEAAVSPQVAYLMNRLLEGVVTDGTGRAAASLGRPLAGKTGTTDGNTDAWFVGYSPALAVGVWVGYDVKKSLGKRETGSAAALPIWRGFMQQATVDQPLRQFVKPAGIVEVAIHRETGLRANPAAGCRPVFAESFIAGTEPTRFCSTHEHRRLELPYPFQVFPLNDYGQLVMPAWRLGELLATEHAVQFDRTSQELLASTAQGLVRMPVEMTFEPRDEPLTEELRERLAAEDILPESWIASDGRRPRIQILQR